VHAHADLNDSENALTVVTVLQNCCPVVSGWEAEVGRFLDNLEDLPGWMASLRRSETNFRWPMY